MDKNDPDRAPKFSPQTIAGNGALCLFYGGKFCAAAEPLALPDAMDTKHKLDSEYKLLETHDQSAVTGFYGFHGSESVFFHHFLYTQNPSAVIDLVKVTGYYDDDLYYGKTGADAVHTEEGELLACYLVYISADYLKGPNAYADWQENIKNPMPPKVDPIQRFKCSIEH